MKEACCYNLIFMPLKDTIKTPTFSMMESLNVIAAVDIIPPIAPIIAEYSDNNNV